MGVGVVEAGHDEGAVKIDDVGDVAFEDVGGDEALGADGHNFAVLHDHYFGPRLGGVVGVDMGVFVDGGGGGGGRGFLGEGRRKEERKRGEKEEKEEQSSAGEALPRAGTAMPCPYYGMGKTGVGQQRAGATRGWAGRGQFHLGFSPEMPATPKRVRSTRFRPTSLLVGSYHSWREWAPPPLPPAPMAMASMPAARGMLASVEERSVRDWLPTASSAARRAKMSGESGRSSPPGRVPRSSTLKFRRPLERSREDSSSSRTPAAMHSRRAVSRRVSSASLSERISTFSLAS